MNTKNVLPILLRSIITIIVFLGLYLSSTYSYLLFHSIAEIFSIVVAFAVLMFSWNSRKFIENNYLLFLGISFLFIGFLDLLHTLAYADMNIFKNFGSDLPTQLWISARYFQGLSLLIAPIFLNRIFKPAPIFAIYSAITILLLFTMFIWKIFPTCFIEGTGLTNFKKISEYIIFCIMICSIYTLYRKKDNFDAKVLRYITASIIFIAAAELFFTFYVSVFGLSNLFGHFLKIVSFYFIYKAVIETGLLKPYNLLFRNLKKSETALREEKNNLLKALNEIRTLKGILPICAKCKKIRDDDGFWNQIDEYIRDHSEVEFSHGLCPDCAKELYPELQEKIQK